MLVLVRAEIVDDFGYSVANTLHSFIIKKASLRISLRQAQPLEHDFVIKGSQGLFSQE